MTTEYKINPREDFKNLSLTLLNEIKIISDNVEIKTYSDICISFINKHFDEYLILYKTCIFKSSEDIKKYNFSILNNAKGFNIQSQNINLGNNERMIFKLLFTEWNNNSEVNKKIIFDYLIYLNEIIEKYRL